MNSDWDVEKYTQECLDLQKENIRKLDAALRAIHGDSYPARILIEALRPAK